MSPEMNRRKFIANSLLVAPVGALATGPAAQAQSPAAPESKSPQSLPTGLIGGRLRVSRVILGGNLVNLYPHSRDLGYVRDLLDRYNTEDRILQTLAVAEENGINTISLSNRERAMGLLQRHRKERGGKMQWIVCPINKPEQSMANYREEVQRLIDAGTDSVYLHGAMADSLTAANRMDVIGEVIEFFKRQKVPCGIGGHDLGVVEACEKAGIANDFYVKTFHHLDYPTAPRPEDMKQPHAEVPGYWCTDWKAVAERMKTVKKTWIAFKVLAAGAIPPKRAFQWAFQNGGDHILVGMFDWQVAGNATLARESIERAKTYRQRPWCS